MAGTVVGIALAVSHVQPAHAQGSRPTCVGENNGLFQDYGFEGSNYQAGKTYVVAISPPGAATFYGVATADTTGRWGEYWLPERSGTYTANVYTYQSGTMGRWITSCSVWIG